MDHRFSEADILQQGFAEALLYVSEYRAATARHRIDGQQIINTCCGATVCHR